MHYISIELRAKSGETGVYEMIRNIRFTRVSDEGDFSVKVKDVKTVEILD